MNVVISRLVQPEAINTLPARSCLALYVRFPKLLRTYGAGIILILIFFFLNLFSLSLSAVLVPGPYSRFNMKGSSLACGLALLQGSVFTTATPTVVDQTTNITYKGLSRNSIEIFLNIPYGQDTSGEHRFKPPRPYVPTLGSTIDARSCGPACPQQIGTNLAVPITLSDVTDVSEDCLHLNVARPSGTVPGDKLPVLIFIHGGSFWSGQNCEITTTPDGMILESVLNGLPIIHVGINYRLGFFGFARNEALKSEGSENAGLRDQRLAIEWVRDNIAHFGGDPDKITISGQSSGGNVDDH